MQIELPVELYSTAKGHFQQLCNRPFIILLGDLFHCKYLNKWCEKKPKLRINDYFKIQCDLVLGETEKIICSLFSYL